MSYVNGADALKAKLLATQVRNLPDERKDALRKHWDTYAIDGEMAACNCADCALAIELHRQDEEEAKVKAEAAALAALAEEAKKFKPKMMPDGPGATLVIGNLTIPLGHVALTMKAPGWHESGPGHLEITVDPDSAAGQKLRNAWLTGSGNWSTGTFAHNNHIHWTWTDSSTPF